MRHNKNKTSNKNDKALNKYEKYLYFIIVFMVILIITAILQLVNGNSKVKTDTKNTKTDFSGSEMYILTLGELTDKEISKLEDKYKCKLVLTDDLTNNKSYKLKFKDNLSSNKLNSIKEELEQRDKVVLVTIPANSNY